MAKFSFPVAFRHSLTLSPNGLALTCYGYTLGAVQSQTL